MRDVVAQSDLGPEGRDFEPWPVHARCLLRAKDTKTTWHLKGFSRDPGRDWLHVLAIFS